MATLSGELALAIESARAAAVEAQGTEFESYLGKLVAAGEKAQAELATRSEADVQELIAALNEGARAATLILNGKKQLATREVQAEAPKEASVAEPAVVEADVVTKAEPAVVKAEAVVAKSESKATTVQAEKVAKAEVKVAEMAGAENVSMVVPNTSAGRGVAEGSVVPGAWGTMALVLLATAVAGALTARRAKLEAE